MSRFSTLASAAAFVCAAVVSTAAVANDTITIMLDRATVIRAPEKTAMVVIGNPSIADVSVQKNGVMVLTGKGFGETNMLALDEQGKLLSETWLRVQRLERNNSLVVSRAGETETYSCSPDCQPTATLGDSEKHFGRVSGQTTARNGLAKPGGAGAAPR
jgi:Flp pilus assembly secretin CpaC